MEHSLLTESFRLAPSPMAPQTARRRVIAACDGLCDERRDIAELLISELVANAVRHPPRGGTGPEIEISVRLLRTDVVLRVEVEDHDGRPLPLVRPPPEPHESGMGLHLVSQLADAWGCSHARTGETKTVWFELRTVDQGRVGVCR